MATNDPIARPPTPTLDQFFARHDKGERFLVPPGGSVRDLALELYDRGKSLHTDLYGLVITDAELNTVSQSDVDAATAYLNQVAAAMAVGGGTANAHPEIVAQPTQPQALPAAQPVAATPEQPAPASPVIPATPLTPGAVVTPEHHNAVTSTLGNIARGLGGLLATAAEPEHLTTIIADVQLILTLFGKKS